MFDGRFGLETTTPARDVLGGALLVVIGAAVAIHGTTYGVSGSGGIGSGLFPVALGVMLAVIGFVMAVMAWPRASLSISKAQLIEPLRAEIRGFSAIALSVVAFIVVAKFLGLAPAAFVTVLVAALGDRTSTIKSSLILAFIVTIFAVALFSYVLRVPMEVFKLPGLGGA